MSDPDVIFLDADDEDKDDDGVARRRTNLHSVTPPFQWTAPGTIRSFNIVFRFLFHCMNENRFVKTKFSYKSTS